MDDAIISRFEKYIDKSGECWLWTGYCASNGYGQFHYEKKVLKSHQFAYLLANGELPASPLVIRHKCKSKNCVNPNHLESGTKSQNQNDRIRDGTDNRGIKNHAAKLTEEQIKEIRLRHTETQRILAEDFGVSQASISLIINGKTWA